MPIFCLGLSSKKKNMANKNLVLQIELFFSTHTFHLNDQTGATRQCDSDATARLHKNSSNRSNNTISMKNRPSAILTLTQRVSYQKPKEYVSFTLIFNLIVVIVAALWRRLGGAYVQQWTSFGYYGDSGSRNTHSV